ncbi:MAG TPA: glycine--tRNA ligase subunit beta [Stellaceae bacterium]|nr:glycine--tRNA ligase subunit beta [Stellaceae bacterium]
MGELLLELLSEEIPARMQRRAIDDLTALVQGKLADAEIPAQSIRGYVTPRRLTVIADGIPLRQPDRHEERRGPRVGAPAQAIEGFLRAAGLASIDQCERRDTGRGEFYFAEIDHPGRDAAEVLPELLRAAIGELPWPKSMRFPASELRWVRPLNSVICLFDGEVLALALDAVPVGRVTRGHRFLSEGEIPVASAADYLEKLEAAHVILDQDRRRQLIAADLERIAKAAMLRVKPDPGLLDEVTGLVEYPVVLMGRIDDEFVRPLPEGLPPEVLATAMRTHQKYFSCLNADGAPQGPLAPRFLFVANNLTPDDGRTIVAGNERVLRARLADARFFWDQDRKVRLEDRVEALKDRVYYDKLGTMYNKTERMERLAGFLAEQLYHVTPAKAGVQEHRAESVALDSRLRGNDDAKMTRLAQRAAQLAKADLSTGMVGEFPELQGIMGRYYALNDGEDPRVAEAIAEHYKPLGPNDTCPTAPVSIIVALADKLDAIEAFYFVDEWPTGSRDPFALRRAALGAIRLILQNRLRLRLFSPLGLVAEVLGDQDRQVGNALLFILDRLNVHLREQGVRHDLIRAVQFPTETGAEDDLVRLLARVEALSEFLDTEDGANLLVAYRRAANIVAIEERRDGCRYDGPVDATALPLMEESALWQRLNGMSVTLDGFLAGEHFDRVMGRLATLRRPVDEFFDKVTVNTDDRALRENRLRLLSRIRAVMNQVADFSQIEG